MQFSSPHPTTDEGIRKVFFTENQVRVLRLWYWMIIPFMPVCQALLKRFGKSTFIRNLLVPNKRYLSRIIVKSTRIYEKFMDTADSPTGRHDSLNRRIPLAD